MTKMKLFITTLSVVVVCLLASSNTPAQATRTWVSGVGDDVNPCSRTAPCKTYAGAISKTATGGEISTLDPGGFGSVTITKSITIDGTCGAGFGSILAASANGVIVNVTTNPTTAVVTLRNLSINGIRNSTAPGLNGIRYLAGKTLHVESTRIFGFSQNGIDANLTTNGNLVVKNSTLTDNNIAIRATTTSGTLAVAITNSELQGNSTGLDVLAGTVATIANSAVTHNSNFGIITEVSGIINADSNILSNNNTAVSATAGTTIRLSNNGIYNNSTGISAVGTVSSDGTNRNAGNTTPGAPNGPAITRH